MIWGAAWLYKATNEANYWNFVKQNIQSMGGNLAEFGWDSKHAGITVLVSQVRRLSFSLQYSIKYVFNLVDMKFSFQSFKNNINFAFIYS